MTNQLSEIPWTIDTTSNTAVYTSHMFVRDMEFAGYASASDFVEVQDRNGNVVALLTGKEDLSPVKTYNVGWIIGLLVPVNGSVGVAAGNPNLVSGVLIVRTR